MFNVEYIKCETRNDKYCFSVFNILKQLLATDDTDLFEKVKIALQQASMWQVREKVRFFFTQIFIFIDIIFC